MTWLLYLLAGAGAGVLAGLFGIGGGMVIVPVLVFVFAAQGISPEVLTHMAIATSLATIVFTSLSSVQSHHKRGAVDWPTVNAMTVGIIFGVSLGVVFIQNVPGIVLQKIIGIFAWLTAIKMAFDLKPTTQSPNLTHKGLIGAGSVIGFASSWFGIGGGTFTVPYLNYKGINMQKAVATSAACGLPIALTGAVVNIFTGWNHAALPNYSSGFLYWPAIIGISLASVPCAKVGAQLAHKLDANMLKKAFALLLFAVGVKFLFF